MTAECQRCLHGSAFARTSLFIKLFEYLPYYLADTLQSLDVLL